MKTIGNITDNWVNDFEQKLKQFEAEDAARQESMTIAEKMLLAQRMAEFENEKKRQRQEEREAGYIKKHIPTRYHDVTWDSWKADTPEKQKALAQARQAWNKNLLFSGAPGTGKTHLAICLAKDGATFRKLYEVFDEVRHDMDNDIETIDWYASRKLLILDEVGRHKFSDFALETFFKLIDKRWDKMLPTTLITNFEPQELVEIYGAAAIDRLKPEVVRFNWRGMR